MLPASSRWCWPGGHKAAGDQAARAGRAARSARHSCYSRLHRHESRAHPRSLREWATPLTPLNFLLLSCANGLTLASRAGGDRGIHAAALLRHRRDHIGLAGLAATKRHAGLKPKSTPADDDRHRHRASSSVRGFIDIVRCRRFFRPQRMPHALRVAANMAPSAAAGAAHNSAWPTSYRAPPSHWRLATAMTDTTRPAGRRYLAERRSTRRISATSAWPGHCFAARLPRLPCENSSWRRQSENPTAALLAGQQARSMLAMDPAPRGACSPAACCSTVRDASRPRAGRLAIDLATLTAVLSVTATCAGA